MRARRRAVRRRSGPRCGRTRRPARASPPRPWRTSRRTALSERDRDVASLDRSERTTGRRKRKGCVSHPAALRVKSSRSKGRDSFKRGTMNRREFVKTSAALIALSSGLPAYAEQLAATRKRVGLIGTGWYGKADLLRMIQVAPVEVVSLCDGDRRILADAAALVATRQASGKTPRTYTDYRAMLRERDLDIVLVGTPDHWHALPMIEAVRSGADVWVQKPVSVDVVEGQAMLAAARKYKRVVQVGMQRRSTPHLVTARDRVIREGRLGTIGLVEIYCYYHMRATANPPDTQPPAYLDYEIWTAAAPMRPYNSLVHPRSWPAFMEYGNAHLAATCV